MEKIIIVIYTNISGLSKSSAELALSKLSKNLTSSDDVLHYIIPTTSGADSRVECLNPKLVSDDEYKQAKEFLDKTKIEVENILLSLKKKQLKKMSLLNCIRKNCDEIMCRTYIPNIGYICRECKNEFKFYISNKGTKIISEQQIRDELESFMTTYKHTFNAEIHEIDIEAFFEEHTN